MADQMIFKRCEIKYMLDITQAELLKNQMKQYMTADKDTTVFVELKKKYESVVYKRRIAMTEDEAERYLLFHEKVKDTQITREIDYCLKNYKKLAPAVMLSYERAEKVFVTLAEGHGIVSKDDLKITGGTYDITAAGHALSGKDSVRIADGTYTLATGEKMELNGGYIHILADGDGVDSNGDLTINGGEIYIDGPSDNGNSAIDYGDRSSAYVNGGMLVAIGSSGMAEGMSDSSKQKVLMVKLGEQMEAGDVVLTDSEGNVIVSYTALKSYDCVIISTADMEIPFRSCCSQQRQRLMTVWRV